MEKDFEILPHTSDLKLRIYGKDLPQLFCNAIKGMFQAIRPRGEFCRQAQDGHRIECVVMPIHRLIEVSAADREALLVDFLSHALYLSDANAEAYFDCHVHTMDERYIKAGLMGVPIEGFEEGEIKAVTYHDLVLEKKDDGWQAEVLFDL